MDVPGAVQTLINNAVPAVVAARARNEQSQTEYGTFGYRTKDGELTYTWVGPGVGSRSYNPKWDLADIKTVGGTPLVLIHGHVWPDYRGSSFEDQDYARGLIPGTTRQNPDFPNGVWVVTVRDTVIEVINPTGNINQQPIPKKP